MNSVYLPSTKLVRANHPLPHDLSRSRIPKVRVYFYPEDHVNVLEFCKKRCAMFYEHFHCLFCVTAASLPEIMSPLKPVSAAQGKRATFECRIDAQPAPEISWSVYKSASQIIPYFIKLVSVYILLKYLLLCIYF